VIKTATTSPYTQVLSSSGFRSRRESSIGIPAIGDLESLYGDAVPLSGRSQTFENSEYGDESGASIRSAEWLATASRGWRTMAVDIEHYRNEGVQGSEPLTQTLPASSAERDGFDEGEISNDNPFEIKPMRTAPRKMTPMPTRPEFSGVSMMLDRREFDSSMERMKEDARRESVNVGLAV